MSTQLTIRQVIDKYKGLKQEKLFPVFARITDMDSIYTKEGIMDKLGYDFMIVSNEEATKVHYHMLALTCDEDKKNRRQNFLNNLKKCFPELVGNSSFSVSQIHTDSATKLAAYTVKDGCFCYKGFSEEDIRSFMKVSYKKIDKKRFAEELDELRTKFLTDKINNVEFLELYCILKASYNQVINPNYVIQLLNTLNVKKYGAHDIGQNLIEKWKNQFR